MELVTELPVDQAARQNPVQTMEKCLPPVGRDLADCPRCRRPGTSRCPSDGLPDSSTPDVAVVSPEDLVSPVPRQSNGHIMARQLRNEEGHDLRRVRKRFVVNLG